MKRKGYTMAEIIVAMVIVAIVAAIAIPGYIKTRSKAEKNQAIAYLRNIRTAEKMYYGKWRTYLSLSGATTIQNALRVESKLPSTYTFAVNATAQTFSAATTGPGGSIFLNESGVWTGSDPFLPQGTD